MEKNEDERERYLGKFKEQKLLGRRRGLRGRRRERREVEERQAR